MVWFLIFVFLVFGLVIGSFLNCLIWRLYSEETIGGRSYCPQCRHQIAWYDNLPVLSFIVLRGRCRHCHKKISWQYPLVELAVGIAFVLSFFHLFGFSMPTETQFLSLASTWTAWLFWGKDILAIAVMTMIFVFDWRWMLVPNGVIWPSAIIFLAVNFVLSCSDIPGTAFSWISAIIAIIAALAFFGSQYILTRGRGLGEGDIWIGLLMAGLFADWRLFTVATLLSYFIGAFISVLLLFFGRKKWGGKLPLGVFLGLGTLITLFFGQEILAWYLGWL